MKRQTQIAERRSGSFCLNLSTYENMYRVSQKKSSPLRFSGIFPKRLGLGIFSPNFTRLLYVSIYTGLQNIIQLAATLTKLCHIKRDYYHMLKMSTITLGAHVFYCSCCVSVFLGLMCFLNKLKKMMMMISQNARWVVALNMA